MITKERFEMLLDAVNKGADLTPIDFKNMDEYERENFCGLGVHVHIQQRPVRIEFLYEWTKDGESVFTGITMELIDPGKLKTLAEYEEMAKIGEERGIPSMNIQPGELKRITVEEYEENYGDEEDEG